MISTEVSLARRIGTLEEAEQAVCIAHAIYEGLMVQNRDNELFSAVRKYIHDTFKDRPGAMKEPELRPIGVTAIDEVLLGIIQACKRRRAFAELTEQFTR